MFNYFVKETVQTILVLIISYDLYKSFSKRHKNIIKILILTCFDLYFLAQVISQEYVFYYKNPHQILGLPKDASKYQVDKKFRYLMQKAHPEKELMSDWHKNILWAYIQIKNYDNSIFSYTIIIPWSLFIIYYSYILCNKFYENQQQKFKCDYKTWQILNSRISTGERCVEILQLNDDFSFSNIYNQYIKLKATYNPGMPDGNFLKWFQVIQAYDELKTNFYLGEEEQNQNETDARRSQMLDLKISTGERCVDIMELTDDLSSKNIRKQYLKLSKIYHPDKNGDEEDFKKLKEAYETLTNLDEHN